MDTEMLTIGRLARSAGVGVETVRYYERQGLLERPSRPFSGYRQYPPDSAVRLRFIRAAKELGFSLREIRELLDLGADSDEACRKVREIVTVKAAGIEQKIEALNRIKGALDDVLTDCLSPRLFCRCPLLEALERRATR